MSLSCTIFAVQIRIKTHKYIPKQDNNDFIEFKRIVGFTLKMRQALSGTARCKMNRAMPLLQLGPVILVS